MLLHALLLLPGLALAGARPASPLYGGNCQSPRWSPDGAKLSWEVNDHEHKTVSLYVYSPGQGPPRAIRPVQRGTSSLTAGFGTAGAAGTETVSHELSWSPTALGRFVYSASAGSRDYELYLDQGAVLAPAPAVDGGPAWSPDGKWIVFTSSRTGQGDLYLLDVNTLEQPPRLLVGSPTSSEVYATWSPDSRSLVFVSHTDKGDELSLIPNFSTPVPQALTSWSRTQTRPSFSPDGKWIAFYSNHAQADRFDLYAVLSTGGAPKLIASGVVLDGQGPSWTPDSANLVFVKDDDNKYDPVMLVPVSDLTRLKTLDTGTVGNGDLDVARGTDGKVWLAVAAQGRVGDEEKTYKRIYVMELGG